MQTYKTYATVENSGRIVIDNLPFPSGSIVEILVVDPSGSPAERVANWNALMRHVQALPQSATIDENDIAAEIEAYRSGH
jgi:hypothetical protein